MEGIVTWGDVKEILAGLEKNLRDLGDQSPNHDQRASFWYSSGVVEQKMKDLGLLAEPAKKG